MSRAPLVLASRSPQRRAILTQLGLPFRIAEPDYHEAPLDLPPERVVEERSRGKARSVAQQPGDGPVLGVDTEVVLDDGTVLGQPPDAEAARAMLAALAGRAHRVISGLTVRDGELERTAHAATTVTFRPLADDEISAYVGARRVARPGGRVRHPGGRRRARRTGRRRLRERRRAAGRAARGIPAWRGVPGTPVGCRGWPGPGPRP